MLNSTTRAQCAYEPLGEHTLQGRSEQIAFDPHVDEPCDGRSRAVGMKRRQHQMSGQRGLNGDPSGLEIANFADHDDIGVLPEDRTERMREIETNAGLNLDLVDAGDLVLDRILDGEDLGVRRDLLAVVVYGIRADVLRNVPAGGSVTAGR